MSGAPDTAVVISAGGSGERLGRAGGKQLIEVAGRPLFAWALAAFLAAERVGLIVVACPAADEAEYRSAVARLAPRVPVVFAPSGVTRQASVASGLAEVDEAWSFVAVHDGARPLVTPELLDELLAALEANPDAAGAVPGHPSVDTLKIAQGNRVGETPDRSRFWAVQTPQVFRRAPFARAHRRAAERGREGTDDASLVEVDGGTVLLVPGPRDNVKVTLVEDLGFVEAALGNRMKGGVS